MRLMSSVNGSRLGLVLGVAMVVVMRVVECDAGF